MPEYALPQAPPDNYAPVVDFDYFMTYVFDWRQDQHVAIIGPTEQGKSNLAYHLLALRSYVAYMGIKSKDRTLDAFAGAGGYQRPKLPALAQHLPLPRHSSSPCQ